MQANWLVLTALFFLLPAFPGLAAGLAAGEAPGVTARQREIVRELDGYRPPWEDGTAAPAAGAGGWMTGVWDTDRGLDELVTLPVDDGSGLNAAACFKALEEYYPAEKALLEDDGADARGVDELIRAADIGRCRFVPDFYPEFDTAKSAQPDMAVLRDYLQGLLRRGERALREGRVSEAERCFRAALVCGRHLTADRSTGILFATGLLYKARGAQAYAGFLLRSGERDRADAARRYARTLGEFLRAFAWKTNVALGEHAGFACLPAVIRIATGDAEPFWRKEAVMRLGTLRYGVADAGKGTVERNPLFELAADEALASVAAGDPDASVRRLAVWVALNASPRGYAGLEHRFDGEGEQ